MKKLFLGICVFLALTVSAQSKVINICDLGAKSSNTTENTAIIQKAIDDVSAAGGGLQKV
jgi:polygalacturonase